MRILFKIVLAGVALAAWLIWSLALPVSPPAEKFVMLRPGWSSRHIALELKNAGVIRSPNAFLLYHYFGSRKTLKAGEYRFEAPASAVQIHARLARGDVYKHTVVIPEGFNIFEIAAAIEAAGLGSREDFLTVARANTAFIADIDPQAKTLEGYLFPDTYQFTRTQSMSDIAAAMVRRFRQEASALGMLPNAKNEAGMQAAITDLHQIVTLASIVEKETSVPEERPLVASVYYNRLSKGIALAADPSVIYAALLAGRYQGSIYRSDLLADSPYNTYRYAGLPPGPIANPGRESLLAALHPGQSDYYYFVSDGNGRHRFARTLNEHSRNVAAYRRALTSANR